MKRESRDHSSRINGRAVHLYEEVHQPTWMGAQIRLGRSDVDSATKRVTISVAGQANPVLPHPPIIPTDVTARGLASRCGWTDVELLAPDVLQVRPREAFGLGMDKARWVVELEAEASDSEKLGARLA